MFPVIQSPVWLLKHIQLVDMKWNACINLHLYFQFELLLFMKFVHYTIHVLLEFHIQCKHNSCTWQHNNTVAENMPTLFLQDGVENSKDFHWSRCSKKKKISFVLSFTFHLSIFNIFFLIVDENNALKNQNHHLHLHVYLNSSALLLILVIVINNY